MIRGGVINMAIDKIEKMKGILEYMKALDLKPNFTQIAKEFSIDRRTVKKLYVNYNALNKRKRLKNSRLEPYKEEITDKLKINRTSIKAVYEFLSDKYDDIGSYSNFKVYVKKQKLRSKVDNSGKPRYECDPGEMIQVDWKENIQLTSKSGELFTVNIFHMLLKYSKFGYLELSIKKERSDVIRCLINGFKFFGGTTLTLLFDNMRTIVDIEKNNKRVNGKIAQFARDFNFKVRLCKFRAGYTKGSNEARNKMLDWLRPYDNEFDTLDDLIKIVESINTKINMDICVGTNYPPITLFYTKEKEYLNPLPQNQLIDSYLTPDKVKVSNEALIYFKGNKYSVRKKLINEYVSLEIFNNQLYIYYKGKLETIHEISLNIKNRINYKNEHYKEMMIDKVKENELNSIVEENLKRFDKLLEPKRVLTVSKMQAMENLQGLEAYISSKKESTWIIRYYSKLSIKEKNIFYQEMCKLLPYVIDEQELFNNMKYILKNEAVEQFRLNILIQDSVSSISILNEKGFELLKSEYEVQYTDFINELSQQKISEIIKENKELKGAQ